MFFHFQFRSYLDKHAVEMIKNNLILIQNNNLHIEITIDSNHVVGKIDKSSISDVVVESAISTIIDNEDSVAAVDAEELSLLLQLLLYSSGSLYWFVL